jgi:phosphonate ABC transporter permease subunit PhnE
MGQLSALFTGNAPLAVAGLVATPIVVLGAMRYAMPQQDDMRTPGTGIRLARGLLFLISGAAAVLALFLVAHLAGIAGASLARALGPFGFLGTFVMNLGDILGVLIVMIVALTVGAIIAGWAGTAGQFITERFAPAPLKGINLALGALAGATLGLLTGGLIDWFYSLDNAAQFIAILAVVGAVIGAATAARYKAKDPLPIGLAIYFVVRTILNALRSIEAFIMAIIFVVLVTTGPFAGVLALTLHTIAALAKLYSEQVESIMPGPLEAVRATGANRLQTIIYAVIPQIIPPYISFTMYRWDINVRMSTIIGFAGGGGIGFLLQQNINLLNYRGAAAQILAIAIVVALMDYISSELRERFV